MIYIVHRPESIKNVKTAAERLRDSDEDSLVIFTVDISGSMYVTTYRSDYSLY